MTNCPACDGPGIFIGQLGNLAHFKCQHCGIEFHTIDVPESYCEEEEETDG